MVWMFMENLVMVMGTLYHTVMKDWGRLGSRDGDIARLSN
jgi:hypothetical protein